MRFVIILLMLVAQLCHAAPPTFAPVTPGRQLVFPADFGAHPQFKTEWWYVTGWLKKPDGKPLGFQVTFFRSATGKGADNPSAFAARQLIIGHAALSDPARGKLAHTQRSAREGFNLAYSRVGGTDIRLDDWRMVRAADGSYQVSISSPELTVKLTLVPTQPLLLQGVRGYSRKGPDPANASYYYSEPHLKVSGSAGQGKAAPEVVEGTAWLDHEWSSQALDPKAAGWDWVGANLADGSALMAFQIRGRQGGKLWAHATLRDAQGNITQFEPGQVSFTPQAQWRSPRTNAVYPVAQSVVTGAIRWQITPLQQDQELDSRRSTGFIYWEGAVNIRRDGVQAGHGYLELVGYASPMTL